MERRKFLQALGLSIAAIPVANAIPIINEENKEVTKKKTAKTPIKEETKSEIDFSSLKEGVTLFDHKGDKILYGDNISQSHEQNSIIQVKDQDDYGYRNFAHARVSSKVRIEKVKDYDNDKLIDLFKSEQYGKLIIIHKDFEDQYLMSNFLIEDMCYMNDMFVSSYLNITLNLVSSLILEA